MMSKLISKDMSRRSALKRIAQGAGVASLGGLLWGGFLDKAKQSDLVLRPPGALPEADFIKACIKCGICVANCPYDTLQLAKSNDDIPLGTPYFIPRETPCYMCPDIPCVPECPTGALDLSLVSSPIEVDETSNVLGEDVTHTDLDINKAEMGLAIIHKESCIAFWGIQCDACYRACPLLDEAIKLDYTQNERTGKHAMLTPVVNAEACTGCGICEHACVTEKAAIKVFPVDLVSGEAGDFYIKGWQEQDEKRLQNTDQEKESEAASDEVLDYLNDWESLIDEE
jgi:ferredoxin-type protein NapG